MSPLCAGGLRVTDFTLRAWHKRLQTQPMSASSIRVVIECGAEALNSAPGLI
jgi:hypothetical protein